MQQQQQQQQQRQQQQRGSEQSRQAKLVPTQITMRVDDVAGVPIESDDEAPADVPHSDAGRKGLDEENAKFFWRVNVLLDRTVVEAYANNGSVVISSVSDHESSWCSFRHSLCQSSVVVCTRFHHVSSSTLPYSALHSLLA